MRILNTFYILILASIMTSCGLSNMASKYDTVNFTPDPVTLETHGGKVALSLDGDFPEKYFPKKATADFTPVLVYEGGEKAFKTITVQGEEATGGEATIFNASGGKFKYQDAIEYSEEMEKSTLEIRGIAKLKDKEKILDTRKIVDGVITTSKRVKNNEDLANKNHGYERETILEETATIYFLVNQANIRVTEKSDADIKALKSFAKKGYKTHSISIISYASPEGSVNTNDNVSTNRMSTTAKYTKRLLRSLKVDGASNNDLYTQNSIGEDWKGFINLVNNSNIKDKKRINNIVKSTADVNVREQRIRDLTEIYDAIEDDVLPQLRKATIIIRSYEPKRTDEEIAELSTTTPATLNINELLFSATLTNNESTKTAIYNKAVELHNDARGYNNIACMYIASGDLETASTYLDKAEQFITNSAMAADIWTNMGIIAARKGQLNKAQELFSKGNTTEKNQAILNIRKGEYKKAARYFKNKKSHNATLAQLLNGNKNARCNEATAACHYLNAIADARSNNTESVIMNLTKAIEKDSSYKNDARTDLEFVKLRNNESFIALTK